MSRNVAAAFLMMLNSIGHTERVKIRQLSPWSVALVRMMTHHMTYLMTAAFVAMTLVQMTEWNVEVSKLHV